MHDINTSILASSWVLDLLLASARWRNFRAHAEIDCAGGGMGGDGGDKHESPIRLCKWFLSYFVSRGRLPFKTIC